MPKADDSRSKTPTSASEPRTKPAPRAERPVYEKPRLRRYDQIDQVKPYGPRDL